MSFTKTAAAVAIALLALSACGGSDRSADATRTSSTNTETNASSGAAQNLPSNPSSTEAQTRPTGGETGVQSPDTSSPNTNSGDQSTALLSGKVLRDMLVGANTDELLGMPMTLRDPQNTSTPPAAEQWAGRLRLADEGDEQSSLLVQGWHASAVRTLKSSVLAKSSVEGFPDQNTLRIDFAYRVDADRLILEGPLRLSGDALFNGTSLDGTLPAIDLRNGSDLGQTLADWTLSDGRSRVRLIAESVPMAPTRAGLCWTIDFVGADGTMQSRKTCVKTIPGSTTAGIVQGSTLEGTLPSSTTPFRYWTDRLDARAPVVMKCVISSREGGYAEKKTWSLWTIQLGNQQNELTIDGHGHAFIRGQVGSPPSTEPVRTVTDLGTRLDWSASGSSFGGTDAYLVDGIGRPIAYRSKSYSMTAWGSNHCDRDGNLDRAMMF